MAGDSPGRAEQRKSSGETTGTAGAVADPRLLVPDRADRADRADADRPDEKPSGADVTAPEADAAGASDAPESAETESAASEADAPDADEPAGGTAEAGPAGEPAAPDAVVAADAPESAERSDTPDEPEPAEDAAEPAEPEPAAERADESAEAADEDAAEPVASADEDAAEGDAPEGDEPAAGAGSAGSAEGDGPDGGVTAPESGEEAAGTPVAAAPAPEEASRAAGREEAVSAPPALPERPVVPPAPPNAPSAPVDAPPVPAGAPAAAAPTAAVAAPAPPASPPAAPVRPPLPPPAPLAPAAPPAEQPVPEYGTGRPSQRERTRQQPLPPPPEEPLKLLAQLTNTPPPRETLLRTSVRRVKIWTPLVALLAIVFVIVQAVRPLPAPTLTLTAAPSYTFGGAAPSMPWPADGQAALEVEGLGSLGTHGAQKPEPIASVAKIMTAYLVLRDHPIKPGSTGAQLTVDGQAASDYNLGAEGESVVKVTAGQKISQYEALEDVMIASANNIARMLARWDAGSESAFVKKMNATAKSFGMDHTTYTDPSGLTATTVSTATDQLKLTEKAMADPVFRKVVAEPNYRTAGGDTYNNWNHLVGTNNVVGVKTGTSTAAGGNLVFAAYKNVGGTNQLILGVVLGQYKPSILDTVTAASLQLILSAQQSLTSSQVIRKGDVVGYVDNGLGGRTPVVATRDVQAVGWPGVRVPIALSAAGIPHAAKAGTRVGTLTVGSGPGQVRIPVALRSNMSAPGFAAKLSNV